MFWSKLFAFHCTDHPLLMVQLTIFKQFNHSVVFNTLWSHGLKHTRLPHPSQTHRVAQIMSIESEMPSNHLILCHPLLILPSICQHQGCHINGGQSTGVSASSSVLPVNTQGWSSEWTGWISLQSKGLSRVFSNTTVQKHQFFGAQLSSQSNFHIHTWPQEKP